MAAAPSCRRSSTPSNRSTTSGSDRRQRACRVRDPRQALRGWMPGYVAATHPITFGRSPSSLTRPRARRASRHGSGAGRRRSPAANARAAGPDSARVTIRTMIDPSPDRGAAEGIGLSGRADGDNADMPSTLAPAEVELERPGNADEIEHDHPWVVIVWNDPINLMSYVTLVLQKLFGYSKQKATRLMLQVHHEGKAVVTSATREKAEYDVARLHAHGLWATMRQD